MASQYPLAIDLNADFLGSADIAVVNSSTIISPNHINNIIDAILNIENELGTNPSSGSFTTVAGRLQNIENIKASNTFKTVRVKSSLVGTLLTSSNGNIVSSGTSDTLHMRQGDNIELSHDTINKIINIAAPNSFKTVRVNSTESGSFLSTNDVDLLSGLTGLLHIQSGNNVTLEHDSVKNILKISAGEAFSNLNVNSTLAGTFASTNNAAMAPSSGVIHFKGGNNVTLEHDVAQSILKINFNNIFQSLSIPTGVALPAVSTEGDIFWRTSDKKLFVSNGVNSFKVVSSNLNTAYDEFGGVGNVNIDGGALSWNTSNGHNFEISNTQGDSGKFVVKDNSGLELIKTDVSTLLREVHIGDKNSSAATLNVHIDSQKTFVGSVDPGSGSPSDTSIIIKSKDLGVGNTKGVELGLNGGTGKLTLKDAGLSLPMDSIETDLPFAVNDKLRFKNAGAVDGSMFSTGGGNISLQANNNISVQATTLSLDATTTVKQTMVFTNNKVLNVVAGSLLLPDELLQDTTAGSIVWDKNSSKLIVYDSLNSPVLINNGNAETLGGLANNAFLRRDVNDAVTSNTVASFRTGGLRLPGAEVSPPSTSAGAIIWNAINEKLIIYNDASQPVHINDKNALTFENNPLASFGRTDVTTTLDSGVLFNAQDGYVLLPLDIPNSFTNDSPGSIIWEPNIKKLYVYDILNQPILINNSDTETFGGLTLSSFVRTDTSTALLAGVTVNATLGSIILPDNLSNNVTSGSAVWNGADGYLFIYDNSGLPILINDPNAGGAGATLLNDLIDVALTAPSNGQVLKFSGGQWINAADDTGTTINALNDISNVDAPSPIDGYVLKFNQSSGKWKAAVDDAGTSINSLNDIGDVTITSPLDCEYLKFDFGSGEWINAGLFIKTPTDGYYGGINGTIAGIQSGDKVEDAFDKIEVILGKLAPAKPDDLSTKTLLMTGTYSALEETSGTARSNVIDDTTPTASVADFFDGDNGTLTAEIDAVVSGTRILSIASDVGNFIALNITADEDPYVGPPNAGFWKQLDANITPTSALSLGGPHTYQMKHTTSGDTPLLTLFVDDPLSPLVSSQAIAADGGTGLGFISGVPTMEAGDTITATFNADNVISEFYNNVRITRAESSFTTDVNEALPGSPPAKGATINASVQVAVESSKYTEDVPVTCRAYNSKGASSTANATNNIRIDTTSNETIRVKSGQGNFPNIGVTAADAGGAFISATDLNTAGDEELQLINAKFKYPSGDFTSNTPVAGPDYTSVPVGTHNSLRWATFNLGSVTTISGGKININGATNFGGTALDSGYELYVKVDSVTGWIDLQTAYPGVGSPVNNGDAALVVGSSTGILKEWTFGVIPRTGLLYARIGLPPASTKQFSSLSYTP